MDTSKFLTHFLLKESIFLIKDVGISIIVGDYFLNISEILNKSTDYPLRYNNADLKISLYVCIHFKTIP